MGCLFELFSSRLTFQFDCNLLVHGYASACLCDIKGARLKACCSSATFDFNANDYLDIFLLLGTFCNFTQIYRFVEALGDPFIFVLINFQL